jgi:hypothetical protein
VCVVVVVFYYHHYQLDRLSHCFYIELTMTLFLEQTQQTQQDEQTQKLY